MKCRTCGTDCPEGSTHCSHCGTELGSSALDERKLVSVLFADIAGFTELAETMDPEVLTGLLNELFQRLVPCVERYGGTVDKFMGDAVMAVFGAPTAHENDAERSIRCALDMHSAAAAFNSARSCFSLTLCSRALCLTDSVACPGQEKHPFP